MFFPIYPAVPSPFVERTYLSLSICFGIFVENHFIMYVWVHFWTLYSMPLIYMSIFSQISNHVVTTSLKISFEMRYGTSFNIVLLENCSGFPRSIIFPSDFRVDINFYQKKKNLWNFYRDCVNSKGKFGEKLLS